MNIVIKLAFGLLALLLLSSCADPNIQSVGASYGFQQKFIQTKTFKLASYQRIKKPKAPVTIYIEGDGRAWVNKSMPSDPSPRSTTVLEMAALDPGHNVVYLARPCQHSPQDLKTICDSKYWSKARYSPVVVESMVEAINIIRSETKAKKIKLVGYSGGAAIATLAAVRLKNVVSIRTVAGNLDLATMQQFHKTSPLSESLDPINVANKIKHIPQLHFIGAKDKIIPPTVAENFVRAEGLSNNKIVILSQVEHNKGWVDNWPQLLKLVP